MALEQTGLSPRELAVRFTDEKRYEASRVFRRRFGLSHATISRFFLAA